MRVLLLCLPMKTPKNLDDCKMIIQNRIATLDQWLDTTEVDAIEHREYLARISELKMLLAQFPN